MTDAASIGAAVAVEVRIQVAQALTSLSAAIGAQAGAIAGGATPAQVLQATQAAVATLAQQLSQNLL